MLTVKDIIDKMNRGEPLRFVSFWGGPLSNFHIQDFIVDGVTYFCNEQYMMAKKCELFGDIEAKNSVMKANGPKECKAIGRKCKNFNQGIWDENKVRIVFEGAMAKFSQNKDLKKYLLSTKGKLLIEASPYDAIWGIKMSDKERDKDGFPMINNPYNWRGENLLGFILMDVRDKLLESRESISK